MVLEGDQACVERTVAGIAHLLTANLASAQSQQGATTVNQSLLAKLSGVQGVDAANAATAAAEHTFNYTRSRLIDRPQTQDILQALFTSFFELR